MKTCFKCGIKKPLSNFSKNKSRKDGYQNYCKPCCKEVNAKWYSENPESRKEYALKQKYNIDLKALETMFNKQNNVCAICLVDFKISGRPCVDHDHRTGKVRELLCANCNTAIGSLKENTQILKNAVKYLNKHKKESKNV